jgi:hypothetical protein
MRRPMVLISALVAVCACLTWGTAEGHVFIPKMYRLGAFPKYDGSGWEGEAYFIPDTAAANLLTAEVWIGQNEPTFTFRTDWVDYPGGAPLFGMDADFETVGDFLNDHIYDISDPSKLDEPFTNLIVKFTGYIRVDMLDDTSTGLGLPIWVDYRSYGQDGFRLFVGTSVYRFPLVSSLDFFWQENPIHEAPGMHRVEYTYFNKYDPFGSLHTEYAGIELYTLHGGGLVLPTGKDMINEDHPELGHGTILSAAEVFREEDIITPIPPGDFDADADVDVQDIRWFQNCFTGEPEGFILLNLGCEVFDFDKDVDVDIVDYAELINHLTNP